MEILHLIAVGVILAAWRLWYVHRHPQQKCSRCEGRGCKRCKGDGHVWRFGARWTSRVHVALLRAIEERKNP